MNNAPEQNQTQLMQKRVFVTPAQQSAIEKISVHLKTQTPARFILVADRNGHIVVFSGEGLPDAGMAELAALLAGDLAASQEIARLTGVFQQKQLILREGEKQNTFLCEAGSDLVLFLQTDADVPLGWARLLALEAGGKLADMELRPDKETDIGLSGDGFNENLNEAIEGLWN
jgi:predicted regulator of Ras-like GTPase activity (Roadblock/LC7/MglB family)